MLGFTFAGALHAGYKETISKHPIITYVVVGTVISTF